MCISQKIQLAVRENQRSSFEAVCGEAEQKEKAFDTTQKLAFQNA